ncbi:MAG: class I SAM-dependent methyltransferase [Bryobacteraceae bacterium]
MCAHQPAGSEGDIHSPYDAIADFYQRAWADWYLPSIRPFLQRFLFSALPANSAVLDVCCGCGHVTREVVAQGFDVLGIDTSRELLARASLLTPNAKFLAADIRSFSVSRPFDGALSTFDSLNHLLTYADLCSAFRCIHAALKPGAPFVFDMNLEEAYSLDLGAWVRYADEHANGFVRGSYDALRRRAKTDLIWFARTEDPDLWRRSETTVEEQCYSREEIESAVRAAAFRELECYSAAEAGVTDELGYGRIYARAWA